MSAYIIGLADVTADWLTFNCSLGNDTLILKYEDARQAKYCELEKKVGVI